MRPDRAYPELPGERAGIWIGEARGEPFEFRDKEVRLRAVWEESWIEYARLKRVRTSILAFLGCPISDRECRDAGCERNAASRQGCLVSGVAAHGTTGLLRTLVHDASKRFRRRIMLVSMPATCRFEDVIDLILAELDPTAMQDRTTRDARYLLLADVLKRTSLLAIAIDDVGNVLALESRRRSRMVDDLISFSFRERIRLVLAVPPSFSAQILGDRGSDPGANPGKRKVSDERQAFRRFDLHRFRVDEDYLALLDLWERTLPLRRASHLMQRDMALRLYELCDGVHGALASVLRKAADAAIRDGTERITHQLLDDLDLEPSMRFRGFRF